MPKAAVVCLVWPWDSLKSEAKSEALNSFKLQTQPGPKLGGDDAEWGTMLSAKAAMQRIIQKDRAN